VTWRRIFQYWVDAFLVSIVPYLVGIPFDYSNRTSLHVIGARGGHAQRSGITRSV